MLQDRLEDYIDVNVGDIKMIYPTYIIEEKPDYLIIGDILIDENPSLELQEWIKRFRESKNNNIPKAISGYIIALSDVKDNLWSNFLQENFKVKLVIQPILSLRLDTTGLILENGALKLIKEYSVKWIKYILKN